jgi:hypothetical protein
MKTKKEKICSKLLRSILLILHLQNLIRTQLQHLFDVGLTQKFSFSYFRENNESFREKFRENLNFRKKWRGKRKRYETSEFQEANEV